MASRHTALASFSVRCESVKLVHTMVAAIHNGKKDQYAVVAVNSKGIRVSVETLAKSMHATSYLNVRDTDNVDQRVVHTFNDSFDPEDRVQREIFSQFNLQQTRGESTEIRFKVNLSAFLECMGVYGKATLPLTCMHMTLNEEDNILHLLLDESGVTTECSLTTVDVDDSTGDYEAAFRSSPVIAKCILLSSVLHDVVKEIADTPGASTVMFTLSPREPYFRMHTYGGLGSCTMDIPHSSDAFLLFEAKQEATFNYHVLLFEAALKALENAEQTFIRVNANGMLSLAHKLASDGGNSTIINFTIMPDEPASDEDEDDGMEAAAAESGDGRKRARQAPGARGAEHEGIGSDVDAAEYERFASQPIAHRHASAAEYEGHYDEYGGRPEDDDDEQVLPPSRRDPARFGRL